MTVEPTTSPVSNPLASSAASRRALGALVAAFMLASCGAAFAQATVGGAARIGKAQVQAAELGPSWDSLTVNQRADLAPLKKEWPTLDVSQKEKWLVLARRFPGMGPKERERIQTRMNEWVRMSPLERGRARQNFQEMQVGRADDRQALWDAYQALPAEERKQLAQRSRPAHAPAADPKASAAQADAKPLSGSKRNIVQAPIQAAAPKPISPTVVQAKPGATTTLMTATAAPPSHSQPGLPKIVATEGFVNPATLLPRRGPQGAAVRSAAASAPAPAQR